MRRTYCYNVVIIIRTGANRIIRRRPNNNAIMSRATDDDTMGPGKSDGKWFAVVFSWSIFFFFLNAEKSASRSRIVRNRVGD